MYRLLLVVVMVFLTIILLLNPSVQQACLTKSIQQFEMPGGVLPFNETYLYKNLTNDFLRLASENQIVMIEQRNFTFLPVLKAACSAGVLCPSFYLIQLVHNSTWPTQVTGRLKFGTTPIYQALIDTYNWSLPVEVNGTTPTYCRMYGDPIYVAVRICATDIYDDQSDEMAVVLCMSLSNHV